MECVTKFKCCLGGSQSVGSITPQRSPCVSVSWNGMSLISHAQNPNLTRSGFVTFFLDEYFRNNMYFLFCFLV